MNKKVIALCILVFSAVGVLSALNVTHRHQQGQMNGFNRSFKNWKVTPVRTASFENHFREMCTYHNGYLYFSDAVPGRIWIADTNLQTIDSIKIPLPEINRLTPVFYTLIAYPKVFIIGGNTRDLIQYNLQTKIVERSKIPSGVIKNVVALTPELLAMRSVDTGTKDAFLCTYNVLTNEIKKEQGISPLLHDAGFIYDGKLVADPANRRAIHISRYCNQLWVLDTQLNLLCKPHTIDTFSTPSTNVVVRKGNITLAGPPREVNLTGCAYGGVIYVKSAKKADNEKELKSSHHFVIDVYNETNDGYIGSFHMPGAGEQLLRKLFRYNDNHLLALYEKNIVLYKIEKK